MIDAKLVSLKNWGIARSVPGKRKLPVRSNVHAYNVNELTAENRYFAIGDAFAGLSKKQAEDTSAIFNLAFGLVKEDRLLCIDVDICKIGSKERLHNPELMKAIIDSCGTYWELSQSGLGLHLWYEVPHGFELPNKAGSMALEYNLDLDIPVTMHLDFLYHRHYVVIPHTVAEGQRGGSITPLAGAGLRLVEHLQADAANKVALADLPPQVEPTVEEMTKALASAKASDYWNFKPNEERRHRGDWALLTWVAKQVHCNVEYCIRLFKMSGRYTTERIMSKRNSVAAYDVYLTKSAIDACRKAQAELNQRNALPAVHVGMSLPVPPPSKAVKPHEPSPVMASAPVAPPARKNDGYDFDGDRPVLSLSLPGRQIPVEPAAPVYIAPEEPEAFDLLIDEPTAPGVGESTPLIEAGSVAPEDIEFPIDAFTGWMRDEVMEMVETMKVAVGIAGPSVLGAVADLAVTRCNTWSEDDPAGQPTALFLLTRADSGEGKSRCIKRAGVVQRDHEEARRVDWVKECQKIRQQHEGDGKKSKPKAEQPSVTMALGAPGERDYDEPAEVFAPLTRANGDLVLPSDPKTIMTEFSMEAMVGAFVRGQALIRVKSDEAGQIFGGTAINEKNVGASLSTLTKLWDEGEADRTRAKSNLEGSGDAKDRRITFEVSGQPVILDKYICDDLMNGQGFMARVLLSCPKSMAGECQRDAEERINRRNGGDSPVRARYLAECQRLYAMPEFITGIEDAEDNPFNVGRVRPPVMPLTDDAIRVSTAYANKLDRECRALEKFSSNKAHAKRAEQVALRVATILAFAEGSRAVTPEIFRRACMIVDYSLNCKLAVLGRGANPQIEDDAASLFDWLTSPKRIGKWLTFTASAASSGLQESLRGKNGKLKREQLLERLVLEGKLTQIGKTYSLNLQAK